MSLINKNEPIKAALQNRLGINVSEILQFCAEKGKNGKDFLDIDSEIANKEFFLLKNTKVAFPRTSLTTNMEVLKQLFRKANTQFKRSLKFFDIENYVTENCEIILQQNILYKCLQKFEKNKNRVFKMLTRRKEMLYETLPYIDPRF